MPLPLYDDLHHAYRYYQLNEVGTHFDYLVSKGFTGVVLVAGSIFENPANNMTTRWGGSTKPTSTTASTSYTLNPTWANFVRSVMDRAGLAGLEVGLVTQGSQGAIDSSDTGSLRTENAFNFGEQLVQYYGDSPDLAFWIHGWDDSRTPDGTNKEDTIWSSVTDGIRAGTGPATSKPVTYHCASGNGTTQGQKFKASSWLDFHFVQPGHSPGGASNPSFWQTLFNNTSKPVWAAEQWYAHVWEDSGGDADEAAMRADAAGIVQYGGTRINGVSLGDWYRITWCDPIEGIKFDNAIADGGAAGVATTRIPGPNSYGGATNLIGNNGETAYLDELGITGAGGGTSHVVEMRYSTLSPTDPTAANLNGATLLADFPYYVHALITPNSDVNTVTFYLDNAEQNVDSVAPYEYLNGGGDAFSDGSYTIRAEILYDDATTDSVSASFTAGTPPPPTPVAEFGYFTFDGTTAKYLSTPDSAGLSVTGDIDLVVLAEATTWNPPVWRALIGKYAYGTNQASYRMIITSFSTMRLDVTDDGTVGPSAQFIESGIPGDFDANSAQWLRLSLSPTTGSGSVYRSTDGQSWTLLAEVTMPAPIASIHDGTSALEIGRTGEADNPWVGKIFYAEVWDGFLDAGGTRVANPDFRTQDQATGGDWTTGGTDDHSNVWTVNGAPTYTAPVAAPTLPELTAAINSTTSTSVDLSWTPNSTVNVDHRVNGGAWTEIYTATTGPQTKTGYLAGDFVEYRLELTTNLGSYATNFATIPNTVTDLIRVNCGGELVADGTGDWEADLSEAASGTDWSNDSVGTAVSNPAGNVTGTPAGVPAVIYQSERYADPGDTFEYTFNNLTNSEDYELRFYIAEQYLGGTQAGQRVFHIEINGVLALSNIDPIAMAGANTALTLTATAQPDTGTITVTFLHGAAQNPMCNAIEVIGLGAGTPPTTPTAATGFTAVTQSASSILLGWTDAATTEDQYRVERGLDGVAYSLLTTLPANSTAYLDTGLVASTLYYYRVRPELAGATPPAWVTDSDTTSAGGTPVVGIDIQPGDDAMNIINANPPGSTFIFRAGVHRGHTIIPHEGDTYLGELSGSTRLSSLNGGLILSGTWIEEGAYWYQANMTQAQIVAAANEQSNSLPGCPRSQTTHELFVDGTRLHHVDSIGNLSSTPPYWTGSTNNWFFDYPNNRVYVSMNPTGSLIELADTEFAFTGTANNVTIQDLIVEHYRNPTQRGAIDIGTEAFNADRGEAWTLTNVEVRKNHGVGVKISNSYWTLNNCSIHHNGQLGVGSGQAGAALGITVFNTDIFNNNTAGVAPGWEAGGTKFTRTTSLSVTYCRIYDNAGPGLWTDIDNVNTDYSYNEVYGNMEAGIFHEISFDASIHHNTIYSNGLAEAPGGVRGRGWAFGAGILIAASPSVDVYDNYIFDNFGGVNLMQQCRPLNTPGNGINDSVGDCACQGNPNPCRDATIFATLQARADARLVQNVKVHHNDIRFSGGRNGYSYNDADLVPGIIDFFSGGSWGNSFYDNDYTGNVTDNFNDNDGNNGNNDSSVSYDDWVTLGNDTTNEGVREVVPPIPVPEGFTATVVDHDTIELTWDAGSASTWDLQYSTTGFSGPWTDLGPLDGALTSYTHDGLTPDTTYYYQLRYNS